MGSPAIGGAVRARKDARGSCSAEEKHTGGAGEEFQVWIVHVNRESLIQSPSLHQTDEQPGGHTATGRSDLMIYVYSLSLVERSGSEIWR